MREDKTKVYRVVCEFELPSDLKSGQMRFVRSGLSLARQSSTETPKGILKAAGYKRRLYDPEVPKFSVWIKLSVVGERDGNFDNQGDLFAATFKKEEGVK